MEQNTEAEKQTSVTKKKMYNFRKVFLWTVIPIIVFAAIGLPWALAPYTAWVGFSDFGVIAFAFYVLTILSCIGFAAVWKDDITRGILVGVVNRVYICGDIFCYY